MLLLGPEDRHAVFEGRHLGILRASSEGSLRGVEEVRDIELQPQGSRGDRDQRAQVRSLAEQAPRASEEGAAQKGQGRRAAFMREMWGRGLVAALAVYSYQQFLDDSNTLFQVTSLTRV